MSQRGLTPPLEVKNINIYAYILIFLTSKGGVKPLWDIKYIFMSYRGTIMITYFNTSHNNNEYFFDYPSFLRSNLNYTCIILVFLNLNLTPLF